ncbi:hypothetical protein ACOMHN_007727 [Nucella lapillus]
MIIRKEKETSNDLGLFKSVPKTELAFEMRNITSASRDPLLLTVLPKQHNVSPDWICVVDEDKRWWSTGSSRR